MRNSLTCLCAVAVALSYPFHASLVAYPLQRAEAILHRAASTITSANRVGGRIDGWTIVKFQLADSAYLGVYRQDERFDLTVRKGRFIAFVSGEGKPDVERFAKYLVAAISDGD